MNYKKPGFWVVGIAIIIVIGIGIGLMTNPINSTGFEGRIAIITEDVNLKNPYTITVDSDNKSVYQKLDEAEFLLNKNDMVIVIEEYDAGCHVILISGDIPALRGTIAKNKLSYDTSLFDNNANQAMIKDAMSYDEIDGNEKGLESGIGMVIERKDDWTRVALPMLESDLWFKSDSLSYGFSTSITDNGLIFDIEDLKMEEPKSNAASLVGYIVIKDNTLHFDEVEIIEWEDQKRVKELDLDLQSDMPNGYAIINENQEEITYELADEVEYIFTDFNLNFIKESESEGNRIYQTTIKDEFLQHLSEYKSNDIPLFEQTIPYFIKVKDGKIISITEEFKYTI